MLHAYKRWVGWLLLLFCGCGEEAGFSLPDEHAERHREAETWDDNERPESFFRDMEYHIDRLPRQGSVRRMPWPGSHWPLADDGVNFRWDGPDSLSPIEKLERATGRHNLEDRVSKYYGLDLHRREGTCTQDKQCPRHKPTCGKRRGARVGVCVGVWWGMCHGWSPAAISESEPLHPVAYNGVTFKVNDIKALLTLAYASTRNVQLGERSETARHPTDRAGRALDRAIRQLNPGTFHVALANVVGLRGTSLTMDRDLTYRVFNHPIAGYDIVQIKPVDLSEAKRLLNVSSWGYPYASRVACLYEVHTRVRIVMDTQHHEDGPLVPDIERYLETRDYRYILEVDGTGRITGGEWLGKSKLNHPDFLWLTRGLAGTGRAGGDIHVATLLEIAEMSRR